MIDHDKFEVLHKVVKDFTPVLLAQGSNFVKQVIKEVDNLDIPMEYIPYIFWWIIEKPKEWSDLSKRQWEALMTARIIMQTSGDTPSYRKKMKTPPEEIKERIAALIKNLSEWAQREMALNLLRGYDKAIKNNLRAIKKVVPKDEIPGGMADMYLRIQMQKALDQYPSIFIYGHLINRIFEKLFS